MKFPSGFLCCLKVSPVSGMVKGGWLKALASFVPRFTTLSITSGELAYNIAALTPVSYGPGFYIGEILCRMFQECLRKHKTRL